MLLGEGWWLLMVEAFGRSNFEFWSVVQHQIWISGHTIAMNRSKNVVKLWKRLFGQVDIFFSWVASNEMMVSRLHNRNILQTQSSSRAQLPTLCPCFILVRNAQSSIGTLSLLICPEHGCRFWIPWKKYRRDMMLSGKLRKSFLICSRYFCTWTKPWLSNQLV